MDGIDGWHLALPEILDRLVLGVDLFGTHAPWLLTAPVLWLITVISLWMYLAWQERRRDRTYLAYVSRNLPLFRRIAKQRSSEVLYVRGLERRTAR